MKARTLGISTIFAASDMMGWIPDADKDLIKDVETIADLSDDHVTTLQKKYGHRDVDKVVWCHLLNQRNLTARNGGTVSVPTEFQQRYAQLSERLLGKAGITSIQNEKYHTEIRN